jgi:hypothetical protein
MHIPDDLIGQGKRVVNAGLLVGAERGKGVMFAADGKIPG